MMMLRQGAAITNLQVVFDNLRFAQKQLSKKILKLIQTWTPEKVEKILGRKPTEQFYSKDFIKYDISIQEGVMTDTQRQMHFRQLVDLKQLGAPVSGTMLAKAAPLQAKSEYIRELEAAEKQQVQAEAQAQQIQMQLLEGQMQNQKASSIASLGSAKERFTRAVANMSLQQERSAKAVDDHAQAAVERIKGIKELAMMDDTTIMKYLDVILRMEELSRGKEQLMKAQDVAVAAEGNKLGTQEAIIQGI